MSIICTETMLAGKPNSAIPFVPNVNSATCAPMKVGTGKTCSQCDSIDNFWNKCPMKKKSV